MEDDEYIKYKCPNCGIRMIQPKWLIDKYKNVDDDVYCSESCRYNAETGHPGEEY